MNSTSNRTSADVPYLVLSADRIGNPPPGFRLPAGTRVGAVAIQVANLERSLEFYERVIGYRTLDRHDGAAGPVALLGNQSDDRVLFELHEKRGVRAVAHRTRLGLYHSAVLLPSRADLGRFITHATELGVHVGSSDHLVSEATYLPAREKLEVRELALVKVKGKKVPVRIFELLGLKGEVPAERLEEARRFEQGLEALRARKFSQAWEVFLALSQRKDRAADPYLALCERYMSEPPPPEWDGSYQMETK